MQIRRIAKALALILLSAAAAIAAVGPAEAQKIKLGRL